MRRREALPQARTVCHDVRMSPDAPPAADPVERKKQLRRALREARRAAAGGRDRAAEGDALVRAAAPLIERVQERAADSSVVTVSAYWPTASEPDVLAVVAALREVVETQGATLRVLFPASSGGELLEWIAADERHGARASRGKGFGDEPDGERCGHDALGGADLILAPALAVDGSGTRLGHGGGYYDRALPHRRAGVPVVAVVHPEELLDRGALVREDHDEPVDAVLTAAGLTACAGG